MAELATSSFDDILSKVGEIEGGFQKMPSAPGTGEAQRGVKSEMGEQSDLLKKLTEFKTPEPPKPAELPKPEKQEYSNPLDAFKEIMPVFSIFASLATRHPLKTAMTAMASSMTAFHNGETEKFELERKNAKEQTEYALNVAKQNNDYYNAVIDKEKMDIGQKEALIKAHATMAEDWRVLAGLQNEGYKGAVEAIRGNNEIHEKALTAATNMFKTKQGGILTDEQYQQYANDPSMKLALRAYMETGNARSAIGGGTMGGKSLQPKIEALQRMALEANPDFNPADAARDYSATQTGAKIGAKNFENMTIATNNLDNSIPLLMEQVKAVDPGQFKTWNEFENYLDEHMGDPKIVALQQSVEDTKSDFQQVLAKGGQLTDTVRNKSDRILNAAWASGQFEAAADIMLKTSKNQLSAAQESLSSAGKMNDPASIKSIGTGYSKVSPLAKPSDNKYEKGKWYDLSDEGHGVHKYLGGGEFE